MNEQDIPSTGLSTKERSLSGEITLKQDEAGHATEALASLRADHVMIGVSNFEETLQWYKEKLGFKEEVRWTVEALPGMQLAYLELNGFRIEIFAGGTGPAQSIPSNFQEALGIQGYGHLCFSVDDVDAALAELNRRGVTTFVSAETYPLSAPLWRRVGFVLDNNGNAIEFAGPLTSINPSPTT